MPLRVVVKTAITVVTPPVVFKSFPIPVTHLTAVEQPRDRRRVASLFFFRDFTAVALRRHGGDGCATAVVLVRCHGGHGGAAATPSCYGNSQQTWGRTGTGFAKKKRAATSLAKSPASVRV